MRIPTFYYDGSGIGAVFPARLAALRRLMPDRRFTPARLAPGLGVCHRAQVSTRTWDFWIACANGRLADGDCESALLLKSISPVGVAAVFCKLAAEGDPRRRPREQRLAIAPRWACRHRLSGQ